MYLLEKRLVQLSYLRKGKKEKLVLPVKKERWADIDVLSMINVYWFDYCS